MKCNDRYTVFHFSLLLTNIILNAGEGYILVIRVDTQKAYFEFSVPKLVPVTQ